MGTMANVKRRKSIASSIQPICAAKSARHALRSTLMTDIFRVYPERSEGSTVAQHYREERFFDRSCCPRRLVALGVNSGSTPMTEKILEPIPSAAGIDGGVALP